MAVDQGRDADRGRWAEVEAALERWFLAQESGVPIALLEACGGDADLTRRVEQVLGESPDLVRDVVQVESAAGAAFEARTFGDFELVAPLGRGGMGAVYRARQLSLGREVAIKLLEVRGSLMPGSRLRMRREAELAASLEHPSIVPIYSVGEVDGTPFLAMKCLEGPSLAALSKPQPAREVARIGAALADALDAAHELGIVHRDVKPQNVLLDRGVPVLVDFGLARGNCDPTLTQAGRVAGTLRYMAPERLDGRADASRLDPRVDVYGLGATLYELLAGRELFPSQESTALVQAILCKEPAPIGLRGRPRDLETIVMRALARDPRDRFASAGAMADDLRRYLRGEPVRSRRLSFAVRCWRRGLRHPRIAAAVVASVLLLSIAATVLVARSIADARQRDRELVAARQHLEAGRNRTAHEALQLLASRYPDDRDVAASFALARAEHGLDRLLLALVDRTPNVSGELVGELVGLVEAHPDAMRRELAQVAVVIAERLAGRPDEARRRLAALPPALQQRRLGVCLADWLSGREPTAHAASAHTPRAVAEAVLTGAVLRYRGTDPELVLAELADLPPAERGAPRLLLLEALLDADRGDLAGAAARLRGLLLGDAPPPIWRMLASVQLRLGHVEEAGHSLTNATADRSPSAEYTRAEYALTVAADDDERAAVAARLRARPDPCVELQRLLAELDGKLDPSLADASVRTLRGLAERLHDDPAGRDLTLAVAIEVALRGLPPPYPSGGDIDGAERHKQAVDEWRPVYETLRRPRARLVAGRWLARSLCGSWRPGDLASGLELFLELCRASPGDRVTAIAYARVVESLSDKTPELVVRRHAFAARQAVDDALRFAGVRGPELSEGARAQLLGYASRMSLYAGDHLELARCYQEYEQVAASVSPVWLPTIEAALAEWRDFEHR